MDSNTSLYSSLDFDRALINDMLQEVFIALKEKGYDPVNQIVGYLMSGDPGYISSYKDARKKITSIDRNHILECLIYEALGDKN